MGDDKGVAPSNKDQGYVVRKLIRRAVRYGKELGIKKELWTKDVTEVVIGDFKDVYSELEKNSTKIFKQFVEEEKKFTHALELALKVFDKYNFEIKVFKEDIERLKEKLNFIDRNTFAGNLSLLTKHDEWVAKEYLVYSHFQKLFDYKRKYIDLYKNSLMILDNQQPAKIKESEEISQFIKNETDNILNNFVLRGAKVFELYQTYALPIEITKELAQENGIKIDEEGFWGEFKKHQELSQTASAGMFKGGLADASDETKKLHTAAHLMLAALRKVLGEHVTQKGSNITPERLRFDVSHPEKITPEQIKEVERLVNEAILTDADMGFEEMTVDEAKKQGAAGAFESKYGEKVKVYTAQKNGIIYSKEICGGPHVTRTGELGLFKITKEEASSAGVRRIKAVLSPK
jgi:alanyl-tRNA synthetase